MFSYIRKGAGFIGLIGRTIARVKFSAADGWLEINGKRIYVFSTAITDNVTATDSPAGSLGLTTHDTGKMNVFVSDGEAWQALGSTVPEASESSSS